MKKIVVIIPLLGVVVFAVLLLGGSARAASLPQVAYLGEGSGTFQTNLDGFVVKRFGPFRFDLEPGPTYEASSRDRVWEQSGAESAPPAVWEDEINLGPVTAGCLVEYIGVDDDIDGRRNAFFVNGDQVELISEGMVFSGEFTIQEDGDLILIAEDSVGGWINICEEETPTSTPTATVTSTPIATDTVTPTITNTPPSATPPSATPPSATPTSQTPPPTAPPTDIPTLTPTATSETPATPTRRPRESSCVRINFEVSGQEAVRGLYIVQEAGGKLLASWYALDGWQDSGWFKDIDISHENVYVRVLYYPGPDTTPTQMTILNHAPDSADSWMSWGMCHALEVAWPDEQ